jgi:hypothetical protein
LPRPEPGTLYASFVVRAENRVLTAGKERILAAANSLISR